MDSPRDSLFERFPALRAVEDRFQRAFGILRSTAASGGTIFTCGNGGSAADAEHIVGELMKGFLLDRPLSEKEVEAFETALGPLEGRQMAGALQGGIKAISLVGHPSLATAFANDADPAMVFAQQLHVLGSEGDALIAISTSGNSENVVNALKVAKAKKIVSVALTGADGGECAAIADAAITVPETETHKAQELHLPIYHALCAMLEEGLYGGG